MKPWLMLAFALGAASGSAGTLYFHDLPPVIVHDGTAERVNPGALAEAAHLARKASREKQVRPEKAN